MDLKTKGLGFAALLLSLTSVVHAGAYVPPLPTCDHHSLTIPCERTGWDVAIEAAYVEATNDDLWYLTRIPSFVVTSQEVDTFYADNDYDFGFRVEGSYHYNTGNDITINWLFFHDDEETHVTSNNLEMRLPRLPLATRATNNLARAFVRYEFDAGNLEFGQHIDVGADVDMRVHYGLQYMHLDHDFNSNLTNTTTTDTFARQLHSRFEGIGPRLGADVAYMLGNDFSVVGRGALMLLVGDLKSSGTDTTVITPPVAAAVLPPVTSVSRVPESTERLLVPGGSGKLGINYNCDVSGGVLMLEGGWQWHSYLDVIRHPFLFTTGGIIQPTSSFGLHGPYVMLKYLA